MKKIIGLALVGFVVVGTHFYEPVHSYMFPHVINESFSYPSGITELSRIVVGNENKKFDLYVYSGILGDHDANLEASSARAENLKNELIKLGIKASNINAVGKGSINFLPRIEGESDRAYNSRLIRVEIKIY